MTPHHARFPTPAVFDRSGIWIREKERGLILTQLETIGQVSHRASKRSNTIYASALLCVTLILGLVGSAAFSTVRAIAVPLPDHRAYELVSPPEDTEVYPPELHQNTIPTTGEFPGLVNLSDAGNPFRAYRASANGDAAAWVGESPASGEGGSGFTGEGGGNQYVSKRGPTGWETTDIELPNLSEEGTAIFTSFSTDLSVYTVVSAARPPSTPESPTACHTTPYLHDTAGYHALITGPSEEGRCYANPSAGISADGAHILLYSAAADTPAAIPSEVFEQTNLYDSVSGILHQVNVLPNGEPEQAPNALFGGLTYYKSYGELSTEHTVSADGARVFWSTLEGEERFEQHSKALYARLNDTQPQSPLVEGRCTVAVDACTVQLDVAQEGASDPGGKGLFRTASQDGTRVFFTDCERLTVDSTAHPQSDCAHPSEFDDSQTIFTGNDLYEYDFAKAAGNRLTDLTVDHGSEPLGADVQGVIGASNDGTYVYFVANGVLTAGPNAEGKSPIAGQPNLYLRHEGVTVFIATLSNEDDLAEGINPHEGGSGEKGGDWHLEPGSRTAEVSPNGKTVAFMSTRSLTGYDNHGVRGILNNGEVAYAELPEMFVYQADSARIVCASCNPAGAPPVRSSENWEDARNGWVTPSGSPAVQTHWINEAGTEVYFMSNQPLVPQDTNGRLDVYQWQSNGAGECRQATGCVAPLSSITTPAPAFFIDASLDGSDVFFTQRASLVPRAIDEDVKLYDARVDGGFPEPSTACTGTGCQGVPPAPPQYATPASQTFSGSGNYPSSGPTRSSTTGKKLTRAQQLSRALKSCKEKPRKRRRSCEQQARKRYGHVRKAGKR
jgi:hypothetical protein